jgi:hypothetical protein
MSVCGFTAWRERKPQQTDFTMVMEMEKEGRHKAIRGPDNGNDRTKNRPDDKLSQ